MIVLLLPFIVSLPVHVCACPAEFEVEYPSLAQELRVADQYLRIFLDSGTVPPAFPV